MSITLAQVRLGAQRLADKVNDLSVDVPTWNEWINDGYESLWAFLSTFFVDHWSAHGDFTLAGGAGGSAFDVSAIAAVNFRRTRLVERDPDTNRRRRVRGYNFNQKNDGAGAHYSAIWDADRTQRLMGAFLTIEPFELAGGNYRLYYVPKLTPLDDAVTPTPDAGDAVDGTLNAWFFPQGAFDASYVGATLTVSGCSNPLNNGVHTITSVTDATDFRTNGPTGSEVFGLAATVVIQKAGTVNTLDWVVEQYWEYLKVFGAMKALGQEEGSDGAQAQRMLALRQEIAETAAQRDDGQADVIADVEGDGSWRPW